MLSEDSLDWAYRNKLIQTIKDKSKPSGSKKSFNPKTYTEIVMSKIRDVTDSNLSAAKSAASLNAGRALLRTASAKVKPHLPLMIQGYADHPIGRLITANLIKYGAAELMPDNKYAQSAAEGMLVAAMDEVMGTFHLEEMLESLLSPAAVKYPVQGTSKKPTNRRQSKTK